MLCPAMANFANKGSAMGLIYIAVKVLFVPGLNIEL